MKCFQCEKKIIILITCKCEHVFCVKHQLPEKHVCTFVFPKHVIEKIDLTKKIATI
jgi:predicted nucleic acid binding AN1-type Zn finger protein